MGRAPCCDKNGLKKGPWTQEEDQKLLDYIQKHGHGSWRTLPKNAGLTRCGKSCRLRWTNYLRPDIKRGRFSFEEEETIIQLHSILGNKWSAIAARLPGRTDNEIKNYWNTHIRKKLLRMGIDPVTHSPRLDLLDLSSLLGSFDISRLLAIHPSANSELCGTTSTNLLSSECQNSTFLQQNLQELNLPNSQLQFPFPSFHQLQNPIQEIPGCDATTSQFQPIAQTIPWQNDDNSIENFASDTNLSYLNSDQSISHLIYNNQNLNLASVFSTPASSPTHLNSSSTCINSSVEDERDSYCSNVFKFQIPDVLDVSEFL